MGGIGQRFGGAIPKQFMHLAGKPVFWHTLETFVHSHLFQEIILVCPEKWQRDIEQHVPEKVRCIVGGPTRQASSRLGIAACSPSSDIVVLHDAVRPFVSQHILYENIIAAERYGAVDTCIPTTDTIVKGSDSIEEIPERTLLYRGQTPQSFQKTLIEKAHAATTKTNATDDCQLVHDMGHPVHISLGSEENIKITTEFDLLHAEQIFRLRAQKAPLSNTSIKNKVIAITGGTGGLGRAIETLLEEEGVRTLLLSPSSSHYPVDLTCAREAEMLAATLPPLDGLINCVGYLQKASLHELSQSVIEKTIAVNLTAVINACKYLPIAAGGHIINVASSSYTRGRKETSVYSATKAAVVNFTQALSEERPDLSINALVPPRMNTEMRRVNFPHESEASLLDPLIAAQEIVALLKSSITGSICEVPHAHSHAQAGHLRI